MVTILLAKMSTLGLLKIKVFWNKGYDVMTSVHDVTKKLLSGQSNYTLDVIMWPKFGNSRISMRRIIIISILQGFDQKSHIFWGAALVQVR